MNWFEKNIESNRLYLEVAFQVVLHILLFLYHISNLRHPLAFNDFVFFAIYGSAAWIINYKLLPLFYYKKKYIVFVIGVLITLNLVIVIEEFVLEKLFFPDAQGSSFPGYFYTLFEFLPLIAILTGFKFAWDAHKKQRELDDLQTTIKDGELQYLKSQINPHFLFNNLNNLYAHAIESSPKTPSIILKLSAALRYMLYDCQEDFVSLPREVEHLKNFVALNKLQIENRSSISLEIADINTSFVIAPLILIVFVVNAFKHSTSSRSKDISIDIKINLSDDGLLKFMCKNNFSTIENIDNLSKGIGLENVKKRLQILYAEAHKLKINRKDNVYCVELEMNIKQT